MDGSGIIQMLVAAATHLVMSGAVYGQIVFQSQRIKCLRVQVVYLLLNIF